MLTNLVRRTRAFTAACIDIVLGPFGWDVLVLRRSDQPGVEWFNVRRRPVGQPRARVARPYRGPIDA